MEAYDPRLKSQHDAIRASLSELEVLGQSKDQIALKPHLISLHKLILQHHQTEWELLFQPHSSCRDLNQGGPYCTYFFDSFMRSRPREKVIQLLRSSGKKQSAHTDFQIDDHLQDIFKINSMLSVPLEEHIAIKLILETLIESLDEEKNVDSDWLNKCLVFLADLIKKNIEKEETCLWVLIQQSCARTKK